MAERFEWPQWLQKARCVSVCVWYLYLCRGSKYFKVISDWLISDADLYGTIFVSEPLRTQCDDVVVLVVVFFALLFRSIGMQNTGIPLYEISEYIANILKRYDKLKEQHTRSSKSFSAFICQQKIEHDEIMVSFDVTSLYTTIPIDQARLIIRDLLEHDEKLADRTVLSPRQILDLIDMLLCTTYFKFNGDFYQQTEGAAMGGPTSAIVSLL